MDVVAISTVIILFLLILFVPYNKYLKALAYRLFLFFQKRNSHQ